jgi:D-psicose/D-tagatose/L-ribulose 3-epimerase
MKFAISNLSWKKNENFKALKILKKNKINFLEFSYINIILFQNNKNLKNIKEYYIKNKINLYSMQALLHEVKNAYMFGEPFQKKIFIKEIKKKIEIARQLGVKVLVFGCPKNKKIFNTSLLEREKISFNIFNKIAKISQKNKITFCLEANPEIYGCDFIKKTEDALKIVKKINNNYFKLNVDYGTIFENKEEYKRLLKKNLKYIGHVQISLPGLERVINKKEAVVKFITFLIEINYQKIISIEQLFLKKNIKNLISTINFIKIFN